MGHHVEPTTLFCVRCGAALADIAAGHRPVCSDRNVIAISHILAERKALGVMAGDKAVQGLEDIIASIIEETQG